MTTRSCLATGINSISGSSSNLEQKPISYFFSFSPVRISPVRTLSQNRLKWICFPLLALRKLRMIFGIKSTPRVLRKATSICPSPFPASWRPFTEESSRFRVCSTSSRKDLPYLVRETFRPFFSNNFTPSSSSREEIA